MTTLPNTIVMNQAALDAIDMEALAKLPGAVQSEGNRREFTGPSGREHYRMLAFLSGLFRNATIIDIGTHLGMSALALSSEPSNRVISFDIKVTTNAAAAERGVRFETADLWDPAVREQWKETILGAPLIFLDIDPHEGTRELEFYRWLLGCDYRGLLVLDDIWYFKPMRDNMWYAIPESHKTDVTLVGHWSGSAIVHFGHTRVIARESWELQRELQRGVVVGEESLPELQWTAVTAYFDLTKRPDASAEIRARSMDYYLRHAPMTMALPVHLVVYCDAASRPLLETLRPEHLRARTEWRQREFGDFELVRDYYPLISESRRQRSSNPDPRNTASYYLFCMLRYVMLAEVAAENPFGTSHLAWVNVCIERMGWKSGAIFPKVWEERREKFSTCYIDYQPRRWLRNLEEYYRWGRCGMCSGFFTGSNRYMAEFCAAILAKFKLMASVGLGHADEQLFSLVFFDRPELFDVYLGDYSEMVVNYGWVRDRPEAPVRNVLSNLARSGENQPLLKTLCRRWLDSVELGTCRPSEQDVARVRQLLVEGDSEPGAAKS